MKIVNEKNVKRAKELVNLDDFELSKRTKNQIMRYPSLDAAILELREASIYRFKHGVNTNNFQAWIHESLVVFEKAGYIRSDIDSLMQYECIVFFYREILNNSCYVAIYGNRAWLEDISRLMPSSSNEVYETCKGFSKKQIQSLVDFIDQNLSEREAKVIKARFGILDGREKILEEVAEEFVTTRDGVRQIVVKAIRKLSHRTESLPRLFDSKESVTRAEELIEEIKEIRKSPAFLKEAALVNELRQIKLSPFSAVNKDLLLEQIGNG